MGMSTEVGEHRFLNMDMRWKHAALERMRETSTHLSCESVCRGHELLTGHVENGVCRGLEVHTRLLVPLCSGAFLRGDGREGRPPLFYLVTAAVRADSLFRVMLCDGQNRQECFLAG